MRADRILVVVVGLAALAMSCAAEPDAAAPLPAVISPDVPLGFVTGAGGGPEPRMVLKSKTWTIWLEYHHEIITDAEGPWTRKLYRQPAAGGERELIWDGSHPGDGKRDTRVPHAWVVYDDGALLFSQDTELTYVGQPGTTKAWVAKLNDEALLPIYADVTGLVLWPLDATRPREAYFVPGERDAFDLEKRIRITGDVGIRWAEPPFKRFREQLVWLDWPSFDQQPPTTYRLSLFDLKTQKGWSEEITVAGNAQLGRVNGRTIEVSGQRYDAATGERK